MSCQTFRARTSIGGLLAGAFVAAMAATVPQAAWAQPINDNFPGTTIVGAPVTAAGTNVLATPQVGEPNPAGVSAGFSVYWSWTAPAGGATTINTFGSNYDTTLGVYTGAVVNALVLIAANDDAGGGLQSQVAFPAVAGTTYRIQVNSFLGAVPPTGLITLNVIQAGALLNDNFPGITLAGTSPTTNGTNVGATAQPGEPNPAGVSGGVSVWWSWTALGSGPASVNTFGSNYDTTLGIYTGAVVNALVLIGDNDDTPPGLQSQVNFASVAGTTYRIQVNGWQGATGLITLNIISTGPPPPANDNFPGTALMGTPANAMSDNTAATAQAGEPNPAGVSGPRSVWWSWTATATETVTVSTAGSAFDTTLGVYTGAVVNMLMMVAENNDAPGVMTSLVTFSAVTGTVYRIQVNGNGAASGAITLAVSSGAMPPPGGGGGGGSRARDRGLCGSVGLDLMIPVALLWLLGRRRRSRS